MGEYAKRKSDGAEIKIGTCENMYYLRYEDRDKVSALPNSVNPMREAESLRFRLPFPDEDQVYIGQYENYDRGERLFKSSEVMGSTDFTDESTVIDPGLIQFRHESGLLLNVPCYHGHKLPEVQKPVTAFWNGKSWFMELYQLRPTHEGVKPIVRCRHCRQSWRYDWANIWEYVHDTHLRAALRVYVEAELKAPKPAEIETTA